MLSGGITGGAAIGPIFQGSGTVVLSANSTYVPTDGNGNLQPTTTYSAEIKSGATVLITNTSGSAFGSTTFSSNNFYGNGGSRTNLPVLLDQGAVLGGNGITTVMVTAAGTNSVIAPGDPGQASLGIAANMIQTLHLNGGLTEQNGLTLDFALNGLNSSSIDFGGSYMALGGTLTFNLTGTPVISAANNFGQYKLLTGLNLANTNANSTDVDFQFIAPTGYYVSDWEPESGSGTGNDYIEVQLTALPEPSTYALMGLGLLALMAIGHHRRLRVQAN